MLLIFLHYQHSFPQLAFPEKPRQQGTFTPHPAKGTPECTELSKDYLITLGISSNRLSSISYGEELPVCREKTKYCWQKNRRAHSATTLFSSSS